MGWWNRVAFQTALGSGSNCRMNLLSLRVVVDRVCCGSSRVLVCFGTSRVGCCFSSGCIALMTALALPSLRTEVGAVALSQPLPHHSTPWASTHHVVVRTVMYVVNSGKKVIFWWLFFVVFLGTGWRFESASRPPPGPSPVYSHKMFAVLKNADYL